MPFDKYLLHHNANHEYGPQLFSHSVEIEIPQFLYAQSGLVPGGGAEVLPFNPWNDDVIQPPSLITAPSPLGLPLYSASGFDLLSILARVATRPNPRVPLGPVDLTCAFVLVDVRRHDHPVVYASPSFARLTGYPDHLVLGRNCRFLQAPPAAAPVRRGAPRLFTDAGPVASMRKMLAADKECQVSLVNYRRDGTAFCNLVTVIPIGGGESGAGPDHDVVYHVGFQVDLGEQPHLILQQLNQGTYAGGAVPAAPAVLPPPAPTTTTPSKKGTPIPPLAMSPALKSLLLNPAFLAAFPLTTSTTAPASADNSPLSLILLEYSPDALHVVSLKGALLYVAPSIRRLLGWHPADLVGKSLSDLAHPADLVPLMRALKDGTAPPSPSPAPSPPRTVDMLYRARTKAGPYIWLEARGRLHPEPGKARKAIILSARARAPPHVPWAAVARAGRADPIYLPAPRGAGVRTVRREFWALAAGAHGVLLAVGRGVRDVLGWDAHALVGRRLGALVRGGWGADAGAARCCEMARADGGLAEVALVAYASPPPPPGVAPAPLVVQVRVAAAHTAFAFCAAGPGAARACLGAPVVLVHALAHAPQESLFAELEAARGTSWQYELERLRFANRRLEGEVRRLEGVVYGCVQGEEEGEVLRDEGEGSGSGVCEAEQQQQHGYDQPCYTIQPAPPCYPIQPPPLHPDPWPPTQYPDPYTPPHPQCYTYAPPPRAPKRPLAQEWEPRAPKRAWAAYA